MTFEQRQAEERRKPGAKPKFWTAEKVAQLRAAWFEQPHVTLLAIGKRLGCTKNAIISKAHREKLPHRAQPPRPPVDEKPIPVRLEHIPNPKLSKLQQETVQKMNRITWRRSDLMALPPVTEDEAARLVAEHIAKRGVTRCPSPAEIEKPLNWGCGWR